MGHLGEYILGEGINEIIATTFSVEKITEKNSPATSPDNPNMVYRPNAAPIGIISRGGPLKTVLFRGSHTLENVLGTKLLTANFVFDPVLYVKTAFEDLSDDFFVKESFEDISFFRLKDAEACILFKAELLTATHESCIFELSPLTEMVFDVMLHPVNRGFNCIIDATVHATRYVMNHSSELKAIIDYDIGIAKKCGGEGEREAVRLLDSYLRQ